MTPAQAIRKAKSQVSMCPFGRQYQIHTWSFKHNATWVSHSMDYYAAQDAMWEARVRLALELLGVSEAGWLAHKAAGPDRPDWRVYVRQCAKDHERHPGLRYDEYGAAYSEAPDGSWTRMYEYDK